MVHAPDYRSFLPRAYFRGTVEIHTGRETVDVVIDDPDEIYDPTFVRGITIHGSPRVVKYIKSLIEKEKINEPLDLENVMEDFMVVLSVLGDKVLNKYGLTWCKPFVVLETRPETLIRAIETLVKPYYEEEPDFERAREKALEILRRNSRVVVVGHEWRSLDQIREEARKICRQKIKPPSKPEDYDAWDRYDMEMFNCIQDVEYELACKEKPKVVDAFFLVNGRVVARGPDVLLLARDLLPAYETSKLKEKKQKSIT